MNPIKHIKAFFKRKLQAKRDNIEQVNEVVNHVRYVPPVSAEIMHQKFCKPMQQDSNSPRSRNVQPVPSEIKNIKFSRTQRNSTSRSRYVPLDNNNMGTVGHSLLLHTSISHDSRNHSNEYNDCSHHSHSYDAGHSYSSHSQDNSSSYSDSYSSDSGCD